ncbi:hypothetical protein A9Q99_14305 [Gammaproteobacteria bacterium 45_16_T64]|nr:hypothetical protein A9Q99_14305 [Gammaproteobacteria bacterium 45_16_T64]
MNDLFITHDAIGILRCYLASEQLDLPEFQAELERLEQQPALSFELWWALLDRLSHQVPRSALGTHIGSTVTPKQSGILGYLTQTSATMLDALRCFERFQRLIYEGNKAEIHWQGDVCSLVWKISHGYSTQISDEVVFASLLSVMRYCLDDPGIALLSVAFTGDAMGPIEDYQAFYGGEVSFNQPTLVVSVSSEHLLRPLLYADPGLHGLLLEQAAAKLPLESTERDFMGELNQSIVRALHEGVPTAANIASKLHISSRTLHRRLDNVGVVFRDLLKDIRKQLAADYLKDKQLSLFEIALLLGYSEQSALSRAFVGWYGVTPSVYRNKLN